MQNSLVVRTPENIELTYEIAGLGSRFLAALIDTTLLATIYIVSGVTIYQLDSGPLSNLGNATTKAIVAVITAIAFFLFSAYYIVFDLVWNGQSPGKRLLHLRILKSNGSPLGFVDSVVRNVIRYIDFFPIGYGVGILAMFLSKRVQRLGDLAAGTLVIREDLDRVPDLLALGVPLSSAPFMSGIETLTEDHYQLVKRFLVRRSSLPQAQQEQCAEDISDLISQHITLLEPLSSRNRVSFLQNVLAAYEHAHYRL